MGIRYKPEVDVIAMLRDAGYTSYKLRREKLISESALTKIRARSLPSWHEMSTLCRLLNIQPGDLIEYVPDDSEPAK